MAAVVRSIFNFRMLANALQTLHVKAPLLFVRDRLRIDYFKALQNSCPLL